MCTRQYALALHRARQPSRSTEDRQSRRNRRPSQGQGTTQVANQQGLYDVECVSLGR